uniref:Mediator complex subunit 27 n=1 Tax=Eptatretus burgeri TaxID=7764 RepID=A0A8C4R6X0_EPTBU
MFILINDRMCAVLCFECGAVSEACSVRFTDHDGQCRAPPGIGGRSSSHRRCPSASLLREPRVWELEVRDPCGTRENLHHRVPGEPASGQQGLQLQWHANLVCSLLNQQSLKRSSAQTVVSAKRRVKVQPTSLTVPAQYVDEVIARMDRLFTDMSVSLSRPGGTSVIVVVTLGKVLRAVVVLRTLIIERVLVRAFHELAHTEEGALDLWTKSQYQVFQKVTDHATAASLHYQLPQMPEVVVRSFMMWLHSYISLFQNPCQRCGRHLQDGLPPTWRDFRTLEPFHDVCRQ